MSKYRSRCKEEIGITIGENYLWSKVLIDSEIEKEIIQNSTNDKILVFGKIPKRAIRVSTYTGSTTTPDFVYAIKSDDNKVILHLFVEAKSENNRDSDKVVLDGQDKFFKKLNVEWQKITRANEIAAAINELLQAKN